MLCRVQLRKRRGRTGKSAMNSKLIVKHREMTEEEIYAQVCCLQFHTFSYYGV